MLGRQEEEQEARGSNSHLEYSSQKWVTVEARTQFTH